MIGGSPWRLLTDAPGNPMTWDDRLLPVRRQRHRQFVAALKAEHVWLTATLIVISAKHGQPRSDPDKTMKIGDQIT